MQDSPTCGTFKAIPVQIDESLSEEEEDLENTTESQKKSFLKSMIKAEKISQEGSAILDQVRGHALKHLSDLDIRKKEEEADICRNDMVTIVTKEFRREGFKVHLSFNPFEWYLAEKFVNDEINIEQLGDKRAL